MTVIYSMEYELGTTEKTTESDCREPKRDHGGIGKTVRIDTRRCVLPHETASREGRADPRGWSQGRLLDYRRKEIVHANRPLGDEGDACRSALPLLPSEATKRTAGTSYDQFGPENDLFVAE